MKIIPEPYQGDLVNGIVTKMVANFRTILAQSATGSGKTVIFAYFLSRYLKKFPEHRITILVHREELQTQTLAMLALFGISTVEVQMVETFMNVIKKKYKHYELIIVDECHIGNFFKIFEYYTNTTIIGFTATPISSNKRKPLKGMFECIVTGCQISELIKINEVKRDRGLIPMIIYAPKTSLDKAHFKKSGDEYNLGEMGLEFSKPKLVQAVLENYIKFAHNQKTIIFNANVEHSIIVRDLFLQNGYKCRHLDGETPRPERREIIRWFKNTPDAILCNVGVATTGFDEPSAVCGIVNRCTKSLGLWLQMCGRISRPYYDPILKEFKEASILIDLGENWTIHGSWMQNRDWESIFNNPPKPGDGTAPLKNCPECEALLPMSLMVCPECGYQIPVKKAYSEDSVEVVLIEDLYKKAAKTGKKANWVLYEAAKKIPDIADYMKAVERFYKINDLYCSKRDAEFWHEQHRKANSLTLTIDIGE